MPVKEKTRAYEGLTWSYRCTNEYARRTDLSLRLRYSGDTNDSY